MCSSDLECKIISGFMSGVLSPSEHYEAFYGLSSGAREYFKQIAPDLFRKPIESRQNISTVNHIQMSQRETQEEIM